VSTNLKPLSAEEREIWTEAYRFYERWHNISGNQEEWLALAKDAGDTSYKLNNNPLAMNVLTAIIDTLSDRVKAEETAAREAEQMVMTDVDGKPVTF
jgi:hypothetical protein